MVLCCRHLAQEGIQSPFYFLVTLSIAWVLPFCDGSLAFVTKHSKSQKWSSEYAILPASENIL